MIQEIGRNRGTYFLRFDQICPGSDAAMCKTLGVPIVKGGQNLPPRVGIGLTDLSSIWGPSGLLPPGSGITAVGLSCGLNESALSVAHRLKTITTLCFYSLSHDTAKSKN